ncbi:Putative membrane protein [Salinisphaera shabanensis E1L3A]|jgi:hypothetical protein|uniref:Membrane protein n=1 Tax=Salinisphaera shabanensis E1L3A TaxID=1033802 RepID=U2E9P3_9GAMM|nr:hypothetical protein [Salinisphaera shabanensis]ERJ20411.1 Putative membrane protein [Salinisphaera shabanensis E1L3A]
MDSENLFHWIGEKLGAAIRFIVDALSWLFDNLYGAIDSFVRGLTGALGINASIFSLLILVIGVAMLYAAVRALMRRAPVATVLWTVLGVIVLSWLIH